MSNDADFYSALAAGAGGEEDSDVSDADVAALTEALADMDDMDDALFTSSLKNKKPSTLRSNKQDAKAQERGAMTGTRTSSPPSLNTAESKRGTFTVKDDTPPGTGTKASPRNRPILKKPQSKSFDFGEFDEDDPLAGLLSDEDEGPVSQPPRRVQPTPAKTISPISSPKSPVHNEGKASAEEVSIPRSKSAPPPRRGPPPKKTDDIDFDDDDILGTMGFDDSSPQEKKVKENKDDDEIQAAKSKVADLFGRKPVANPSSSEKPPPAGTTKEFVLDARYKKNEKVKPKKNVDEEDFSFGSYTPSAVNTLQRPDSAPPGRRSVRFADDVDDLFGGTSTLDRPAARGAGRPRSSSQAATTPSVDAKPVIDRGGGKDEDDDWLSLAIGRKATPDATGNQARETSEGGAGPGAVGSPKKGKKKAGEVEYGGNEAVRPASAGDYLGLGEDIDLDTMLSSKPSAGPAASRQRDKRSSLPWDDDALDTTAGLGSTMDSQLLGGTMSSEGSQDDTQSSSAIARQVAEMDKLEQQSLGGGQTPSLDPTPSPQPGQHPPSISPRQPALRQHQPPSSLSRPGSRVGQPGVSTEGQTSPTHGQASRADPEWVSPGIQPSRDPRSLPQSQGGPVSSQRSAQPEDGYRTSQADVDGSATLPARLTSPVSPQAGRKEPQWRQELRMRREQVQGSTEGTHPTSSPVDTQQGNAGTGQLAASTSEPVTGGHLTPSIPTVSEVTVSQQFQEQMREQKRQAEEMERALRDQQAQLRAQQEEQMKQMQRLQQEALQQQMQMQQQLIEAQTLPSTPSLVSGIQGSQATPGGFRDPTQQTRLHQLENEKLYLETSLQTLQDQHKQQLAAKEKANQDYVKLVEDSFRKKEERLKKEHEEHQRGYQERIDEMATERRRLIAEHRHELESISEKHRGDLHQLQQSMQAELHTVSEATGHSRSLQAVVDRVGVVGQELGTLQSKISGDHQQQLERQRIELEEKDKQLKALQTSLQHQHKEMTGERSRLEAMIQRLEVQIRQQNTQLDQERWRLRQEQNKLASLQTALEEERKLAAEQGAKQQVALQQARESLDAEHQERMTQCLEERKALATERARLARERNEIDTMVKKHLEKISRENAEREGRMAALLEDEKRVVLELEAMERQRQDQARERKGMERERMELTREQDELQGVAEKLRLRAQQIDRTVQEAVQVREEGLSALDQSRKLESEQRRRETGIEERLQALRATEKQIAQERLKTAEDERRFELLMREGLCPSCQQVPGLITGDNHQAFLLPVTGSQPNSNIPRLRSHPPSLGGVDQVPTREDFVDNLLNKAEFDHTFSVWRIAADKDKDFLEEESSFLNSLIDPPGSSSHRKDKSLSQ